MTTADRSDTHASDETAHLKTPSPCKICGWRFWRGPIPIRAARVGDGLIMKDSLIDIGPILYYEAECRNLECGNRVKM